MNNLLLEEGSVLSVRNVSLPKAKFVKFKPLRRRRGHRRRGHRKAGALAFVKMSQSGDHMVYHTPAEELSRHVRSVKPRDAADHECDCNVDFDAPVGYKELTTKAGSRSLKANVPAPQKAKSQAREEARTNERDGKFQGRDESEEDRPSHGKELKRRPRRRSSKLSSNSGRRRASSITRRPTRPSPPPPPRRPRSADASPFASDARLPAARLQEARDHKAAQRTLRRGYPVVVLVASGRVAPPWRAPRWGHPSPCTAA